MLTISVGRNMDGITLALPPIERVRYPNGSYRIFIATEINEKDLKLGEVLNESQARAAASILTRNEVGVQEPIRFVDAVDGSELLSMEPWMTPQIC